MLKNPYRQAHRMKRMKKTSAPSNLFFFDTETRDKNNNYDPNKEYHHLWFGWTYSCRYERDIETRESWNRFDTIEAFWDIVINSLDKTRPLYCFAHNLGFDLTIVDFWQYCERMKVKVDFAVLEDPPTIVCIEIKKCKVYFVDTLNYWRCSLASLGESVGFNKLPMPKPDASTKEWDTYCQQDVLILAKSVTNLISFIRSNKLGKFGLSAPSVAMNAFKSRFLKDKQIYLHDNSKVLDLERDCYYGGLVHNFFIGKVKEPVYCYDVNSLYPYCMLEPMPVKLINSISMPTLNWLEKLSNKYFLAAHVRINDNKQSFPKRYNNRLIEATGDYETFLCGVELKRAIETEAIKECYFASYYITDTIFTDYVNYFWELRQKYKKQSNTVANNFSKLLLNSLYGKFAQRSYEWKELTYQNLEAYYQIYNTKCPVAYRNKEILPMINWQQNKWYAKGLDHPITIRYVSGMLQMKFPLGEHYESSPIISAAITTFGRDYLRTLSSIAGRRTVLYVDTDSLYVTKQGRDNLERSGRVNANKLGYLKFEGHSDNTCFYAPKDYEFGTLRKLKGIRTNAEQLSSDTFRQLKFEGIKSVLKRKPEPYIIIERIIKKNQRQYTKGIVTASGWTKYFKFPMS